MSSWQSYVPSNGTQCGPLAASIEQADERKNMALHLDSESYTSWFWPCLYSKEPQRSKGEQMSMLRFVWSLASLARNLVDVFAMHVTWRRTNPIDFSDPQVCTLSPFHDLLFWSFPFLFGMCNCPPLFTPRICSAWTLQGTFEKVCNMQIVHARLPKDPAEQNQWRHLNGSGVGIFLFHTHVGYVSHSMTKQIHFGSGPLYSGGRDQQDSSRKRPERFEKVGSFSSLSSHPKLCQTSKKR